MDDIVDGGLGCALTSAFTAVLALMTPAPLSYVIGGLAALFGLLAASAALAILLFFVLILSVGLGEVAYKQLTIK